MRKLLKEELIRLKVPGNWDHITNQIGMFSYTDLMRLDFSDSFGQDQREVLATLDSSKSIEEVMAKDLVTIKERDTVQSAAKLLCDGRNFHSLPVLNQDGKLSGIVTSTDIIRFLAEL